jgi:hypothetical protein
MKDALIIFARLPRAGEVKTRLGSIVGMGKAALIYAELARHAFELGREMRAKGISVYLYYDPLGDLDSVKKWVGAPFRYMPQQGKTLGERMFRAFAQTFNEGASRSVIIGTDVPELDDAIVANAYEQLRRYDVVIGPSTDGGYYLLGMHAPVKSLFDGIAWSTSTVLRDTLTRAEHLRLSVAQLEPLADIDHHDDYAAYLHRRGGG